MTAVRNYTQVRSCSNFRLQTLQNKFYSCWINHKNITSCNFIPGQLKQVPLENYQFATEELPVYHWRSNWLPLVGICPSKNGAKSKCRRTQFTTIIRKRALGVMYIYSFVLFHTLFSSRKCREDNSGDVGWSVRTLRWLASNWCPVYARNSPNIAFLTSSLWGLPTFAPQRTANAKKVRLSSVASQVGRLLSLYK